MIPRLYLLLLALSVFTPFLGAQELEHQEVERDDDRPVGEEGCLTERTADELRSGGDLDPQTKLELARETYESITSRSRYQPQSIAGATWTSIGPNNASGRISRIAVHPTTPGTFLAGAASGGVWRTTNGGVSWTTLTDAIPSLNTGAVAYAPSDPSTIYVGTGEGDTGGIPSGIGLIWSTDGGATWNFPSSVVATGFFAISVDPRNGSTLVIATLEGMFRSTTGPDGPWTNVSPGGGRVWDVERDPSNPDVLYAAKSSALLKSTNGGVTWVSASSGLILDSVFLNRLAIAIAPSSPSTLYCTSSSGGKSHIHKTTNGGETWIETSLSSSSDSLVNNYHGTQAGYDSAIAVSPSDPNVVIAGGVSYVKTTDGGTTWSAVLQPHVPASDYCHMDVHDLVYGADGTLHIANDGGCWTSTDHAASVTEHNAGLVTRQFYNLAIDVTHPYLTYGGTQDNGTNWRDIAGGLSWTTGMGGDGAGCIVSSSVPSSFIGGVQNGWMSRANDMRASEPSFDSTFPPPGTPKEKSSFIADIEADPSNGSTAYIGTWRLWKTSTFGDAWSPLPTTMVDGTTWLPSSSAINRVAVSASNPRVIMVSQGAFPASLRRTIDGGVTWRQTATADLPFSGFNSVTIDPNDEDTAWVAAATSDGAGVYMTSDGGTSWVLRSTGLPMYTPMVVRVDPTDSNTIYCGTHSGLYRSTDRGMSWSRVPGLPAVSVRDIAIHPNGSIVRIATYGRGIWELNIPGITNQPPVATISMPANAITVSRGASLTFTGSVSDPDTGDVVTGQWTFPDTWETSRTQAGPSTVEHAFHTRGTFHVTLRAQDGSGAMATSQIVVKVTEPADSCATPIVIPGNGSFPVTVRFYGSDASQTTGDPNPIATCLPFNFASTVNLSFTPEESGTYEFSLVGSGEQARIALFTGNACGPSTELANACLFSAQPTYDWATEPRLAVSLTAGVPIRIIAPAVGWVSLTVSRGAVSSVITSIVPAAGDSAGGAEIVIAGSGFSAPATVSFGGTAATNVRVLSMSRITATVPAHGRGAADVAVTIGGQTATYASYVYTGATISAPVNVSAQMIAASTNRITWQAVAGAEHYDVIRRSSSGTASVGSSLSPSFDDASATPGAAYVYTVRAIAAGGATSPDSSPDLATTIAFTDDPLVVGATRVKAVHLSELRSAVAAVRSLAGLSPASYTAGTQVLSVHVTELRTALNQARAALLLPALTFSNSASEGARIRAADCTELRNGVK